VGAGTFGSLVGLLWLAILLSTQNIWDFLAAFLGGVIASVWICGKAEAILKQRDPARIVLDEICAVPICFVPWVVTEWLGKGKWPPLETFFGARTWYIVVILFVLFRIFDILKPPPSAKASGCRGLGRGDG
jgi:phosphatidylglycerophosphatase A